jgi:glucokinase
MDLFHHLNKKYGHVSWERVISGPGIHAIYKFFRDVLQHEEPEWLTERMEEEKDPSATISQAAREDCPICQETLRLFVRYLAEEASDIALKFKATGGIFIGGGIPPKIWDDDLQQHFLDNFFQVGRLRPLLETVPIHLIKTPKTALLGATYYGALGSKEGKPHFRLNKASMKKLVTYPEE